MAKKLPVKRFGIRKAQEILDQYRMQNPTAFQHDLRQNNITLRIPEGFTHLNPRLLGSGLKYQITTLELPASITQIDPETFAYGCLRKIVVHPDNPAFCVQNNVLFSKDLHRLILLCAQPAPDCETGSCYIVPNTVTALFPYSFSHSRYQKIILPEGLEEICDFAFSNNMNLRELMLPSTLKRIGKSVFYNNFFLQHLDLPNGIEFLDENCFSCSGISSLLIPSSLTSIAPHALGDKIAVTVSPNHPCYDAVNGVLLKKIPSAELDEK